MSATVSPDHILKELSELWVKMGKEGQAETGSGVLRACFTAPATCPFAIT